MNLDRIHPGQLRVLGAMLDLRREGRPITYRAIGRKLGHNHQSYAQTAVRSLQLRGLVHPADRPNDFAALRPAVRFIPEDQL